MITYKGIRKKGYSRFYVYKIENPKGEFYIGATTNIVNRIKTYSGDPRVFKNQTNLYKSITNWGWDKHKWEIIYEWEGDFELDVINGVEKDYIRRFYLENKDKSLNGLIEGESRNIK